MSRSARAKHVPRKNGWRSNKSRIFHEHFSGWTPASRFCAELPPGARDWTSCSSQEGKVRTMCSAGEGDRHTRACRSPTPERIGVRWRAESHDGGCQGQRLGPDEPWAKEDIRKTRKRPVCPRFPPVSPPVFPSFLSPVFPVLRQPMFWPETILDGLESGPPDRGAQ